MRAPWIADARADDNALPYQFKKTRLVGIRAPQKRRIGEERGMIELYTWTMPNGRKASIMLEEIGLPYAVGPINLGKNEQFDPEFLKISPNNKIRRSSTLRRPAGRSRCSKAGRSSSTSPRRLEVCWRNRAPSAITRSNGSTGRWAASGRCSQSSALRRPLERQGAPCDHAVHGKGPAVACRARPAIAEKRLSRRRELHHRGYLRLTLDARATTFGSVLGPSIEAMPAVKRWMMAMGEREVVKRGMAVPKV
jgi:GST-like protein